VNPAAVESPSLRPEPSRAFRWLVLMFLATTMFGNYYVYDCIAGNANWARTVTVWRASQRQKVHRRD
jgi:hypothetical protein